MMLHRRRLLPGVVGRTFGRRQQLGILDCGERFEESSEVERLLFPEASSLPGTTAWGQWRVFVLHRGQNPQNGDGPTPPEPAYSRQKAATCDLEWQSHTTIHRLRRVRGRHLHSSSSRMTTTTTAPFLHGGAGPAPRPAEGQAADRGHRQDSGRQQQRWLDERGWSLLLAWLA